MTPSTALEILAAARAALSNPDKWCKGRFFDAPELLALAGEGAFNQDCTYYAAALRTDCPTCAMGAVYRTLGLVPFHQIRTNEEARKQDSCIAVRAELNFTVALTPGRRPFCYIEGFNDAPATTHADLLRAIDLTIFRLAAEKETA